MVSTVTTVLDIVKVVACFLAEVSLLLGAGDVEVVLAAALVALHARTDASATATPSLIADVAHLCRAIPVYDISILCLSL